MEYNSYQDVPSDSMKISITANDILKSDSKVIPSKNVVLMKMRAQEEITLIKYEIRRSVDYFKAEIQCITDLINTCDTSTIHYSVSYLRSFRCSKKKVLDDLQKTCEPILNMLLPDTHGFEDDIHGLPGFINTD